MKLQTSLFALISAVIIFSLSQSWAQSNSPEANALAPDYPKGVSKEIRMTIIKKGKTWSKAIKTKNITLIKDLYDDDAHYLPDNEKAIYGGVAIAAYWEGLFSFFNDLVLDMKSLEGTEELLYETGIGNAVVMNKSGQFVDFKFKYVNVWKLQIDGSYKVVIDIFNNLPAQSAK